MKITLRKANAVQAAINEAIKGLNLSTEVAINEFEKPSVKVSEAKEQFVANMTIRNDLITSLYEIRGAVAKANANSGINDVLSNVAMLEKQVGFYNNLSKLQPSVEQDVLVGKLGKIKSRDKADMYGRYGEEEVRTTFFAKGELDSFRNSANEFRREKQKLQDKLLELNVKTEIELSSFVVDTLQKASIL